MNIRPLGHYDIYFVINYCKDHDVVTFSSMLYYMLWSYLQNNLHFLYFTDGH